MRRSQLFHNGCSGEFTYHKGTSIVVSGWVCHGCGRVAMQQVKCACGKHSLPTPEATKIVNHRNTHAFDSCFEFTKNRYCERPKP